MPRKQKHGGRGGVSKGAGGGRGRGGRGGSKWAKAKPAATPPTGDEAGFEAGSGNACTIDGSVMEGETRTLQQTH